MVGDSPKAMAEHIAKPAKLHALRLEPRYGWEIHSEQLFVFGQCTTSTSYHPRCFKGSTPISIISHAIFDGQRVCILHDHWPKWDTSTRKQNRVANADGNGFPLDVSQVQRCRLPSCIISLNHKANSTGKIQSFLDCRHERQLRTDHLANETRNGKFNNMTHIEMQITARCKPLK